MKTLSRRDLLKSSLLAPAAVAAKWMGPMGAAIEAIAQEAHPQPANAAPNPSASGAGRERLLLDFGWRFHFGNANDPAKDFGFGSGRAGNFQKTGNFLSAGAIGLDDSDWKQWTCPTTGPSSCRFKTIRRLPAKASTRSAAIIRHQRRLVPARLRTCRRGRRQADHRSSSTAPIARRWWSSMAFTSAATAADTIPSASM